MKQPKSAIIDQYEYFPLPSRAGKEPHARALPNLSGSHEKLVVTVAWSRCHLASVMGKIYAQEPQDWTLRVRPVFWERQNSIQHGILTRFGIE